MTLSQVNDRASDTELDFHMVSQLTTLGVLADDVIGDLIRVRAGVMAGSASRAIENAASLFRMVSENVPAPAELWDSNRFSDALRVIADNRTARTQGEVPEDVRDWAKNVATDLDAVVGDRADRAIIARLEGQFTQLAVGTLAASNDVIRQRGYATSWLSV